MDEEDDVVEGYTSGVMLGGGIHSGGLIPKSSPVFSDLLKKKCKQVGKDKVMH